MPQDQVRQDKPDSPAPSTAEHVINWQIFRELAYNTSLLALGIVAVCPKTFLSDPSMAAVTKESLPFNTRMLRIQDINPDEDRPFLAPKPDAKEKKTSTHKQEEYTLEIRRLMQSQANPLVIDELKKQAKKSRKLAKPTAQPTQSTIDIEDELHFSTEHSSAATSTFPKISSPDLKRVRSLRRSLLTYLPQPISPTNKAIYNEARRSEIFLPISFNQQDEFGKTNEALVSFYASPWLSKSSNPDFPFTGFKKFLTVGCMFGTTLRGLDQLGASINLIKHLSKFHDGQFITRIFIEESSNPYETTLLADLEKLAHFIERFAESRDHKKLQFHLPGLDYILFGFELFIQGRITLAALGTFFAIILEKNEFCKKNITEICKKHGIHVDVISPFEKLFQDQRIPVSTESCLTMDNPVALATDILKKLLPDSLHESIPKKPTKPIAKTTAEITEQHEATMVQHWLTLLSDVSSISNNSDEGIDASISTLSRIWRDCIHAEKATREKQALRTSEEAMPAQQKMSAPPPEASITKKPISTIEDIFEIANAVALAFGAQGTEENKVCAWLPLSEKQISATYSKYLSDLQSNNSDVRYPSIFNLTVMDSVIAYSPLTWIDETEPTEASGLPKAPPINNKANLFYLDEGKQALTSLIKGAQLFSTSARQISMLFTNPKPLQEIMPITLSFPPHMNSPMPRRRASIDWLLALKGERESPGSDDITLGASPSTNKDDMENNSRRRQVSPSPPSP